MVSEIILKPDNIFCFTVYVISLITAFFNIYGLCLMYKSCKNFCFEKYVLFSGLFELCLIVVEIFIPDDIILNITQTIQILQPLYITKNFMAVYVHLSYKDKETSDKLLSEIENKIIKYNYYIKIISVAIVLLIIGFGLIEVFDTLEDAVDDICFFIHDIVCLVICIVLFVFAFKIEKLINETLSNKHANNAGENLIEQTENDITQENEYYLTTRKKQIFLISFSYLIINGLEFFITVIELTITIIYNPKGYGKETKKKRIWDKKLDIYEFTTDYACLFNTICNYFTFYFVIKESFQLKYKPQRKTQFLNNEDINKNKIVLNEEVNRQNDVENFLNDS